MDWERQKGLSEVMYLLAGKGEARGTLRQKRQVRAFLPAPPFPPHPLAPLACASPWQTQCTMLTLYTGRLHFPASFAARLGSCDYSDHGMQAEVIYVTTRLGT